jgi:amidase
MLVSSFRQDGQPVVPGPISTALEGISLYMKGVIGTEPWTKDYSLFPLPWTESTLPSASLNIGYLVDDGVVTPDSSIVRAMSLVLQELGRVPGFQLVQWKPVAHEEALKLTSQLPAADDAKDRLEALESSDEPLLKSIKLAMKDARESHPLDLEGFADLLRE